MVGRTFPRQDCTLFGALLDRPIGGRSVLKRLKSDSMIALVEWLRDLAANRVGCEIFLAGAWDCSNPTRNDTWALLQTSSAQSGAVSR